jgi:hypothetical protein
MRVSIGNPQVDLRTAIELPVHRWHDESSGCSMLAATPASLPGLWQEFLDGALGSYRRHGVECALDVDAIADGRDTAAFFVALDRRDRIVAGVRAKGPYATPEESHAVVEWAGEPAMMDVRAMIADRIGAGVAEVKSAWVAEGSSNGRTLTRVLARSPLYTMALLDVRHVMATSATHVLEQWRSSGGVIARNIAPAPYPDARYETSMIWWDRATVMRHAEPDQAERIAYEIAALRRGDFRYTGEPADGDRYQEAAAAA